jgi:hypothetical protein
MRLAVAGLCLMLLGPTCLAGPPGGPSGAMMLDKVADGLSKYRREKDPDKRIEWLKKLARIRDPRVAIVLAQEGINPDSILGERNRQYAANLLMEYYIPRSQWVYSAKYSVTAQRWWESNEADLRRRAKQLP